MKRRAIALPALATFAAIAVLGAPDAAGAQPRTADHGGAPSGRILFTSDYGNIFNWDLYTINPDGTGIRRIVNTPTRYEQWPDFSADGAKLLFRIGDPRVPTSWEIVVTDPNDTTEHQVTQNDWADEAARFSPNGRQIVFQTNQNDPNPFCTQQPCNWDIYLLSRDGVHLRQLTFTTSDDGFAQFSPDGTKIIFSSNREGPYALYRMNLDGSGVTRLTPLSMNAGGGSYSPDGQHIAFVDSFCSTCPPSDIWTMNANGTGLFQVTNDGNNNLTPSWSPDSTQISFEKDVLVPSENLDIYVVNANGTGLKDVTPDPNYWQAEPDWS